MKKILCFLLATLLAFSCCLPAFAADNKTLAGETRYETAINTANSLKEALEVEKFDTIIVAYGRNYADALSGAYLATLKNAPILLVNTDASATGADKESVKLVKNYIKKNLSENGKVYLLGGRSVISEDFGDAIKGMGFRVDRLAGATRYETNLRILEECKKVDPNPSGVIIADAYNFADSLSASALGIPILLVDKTGGAELSSEQISYLKSVNPYNVFIFGGLFAVPSSIESSVRSAVKSHVVRFAGETRYDTNYDANKYFFSSPANEVLTTGQNYPDGLCGGVLAYVLGAPITLEKECKATVNTQGEFKAIERVKSDAPETGLFTGLKDGKYYRDGEENTEYKGLSKDGDTILYVSEGKADNSLTGWYKMPCDSDYYEARWVYLEKGVLTGTKNGGYKLPDGKIYYVSGSVNYPTYTGIVSYDGAKYYFVEGSIAKDFSGNKKIGDTVYYIKDGKIIPGTKIVYLTFDDGPGPYTEWLLNVLDKYGVKATFFVTGSRGNYTWLIGEEARRGHSVAVHSYTHNYAQIYSSKGGFYYDINKMNDIIEQQTGSRTNLIRFPGGSSNTVSRRYCSGIMSTLARSLTNDGYVYFDWNCVSGDAGDTTSTGVVYSRVVNSMRANANGCTIVLQHDIKDFSVAAVESIIRYGLNNGYTFLPLTEDSPTMHQRIAN